MDLENQIADLERRLALKKAYSNVKISFGNSKLPDDVKSEVHEKLKEVCIQLAEEEGVSQGASEASDTFTSKEVEILKMLVDATVNKTPTNSTQQKPDIESKKDQEIKASILTTDSLSMEMKKKVSSMDMVTIVALNHGEGKASVIHDKTKARFALPLDEIEVIEGEL